MAIESAGADVTAAAEISDPPQQVLTTPAAVALMETLRAKYGPLMFHQSGGCCDGSSPMCYPLGEFMTGDSDVLLATIGDAPGVPFYMSKPQFEYWKHTQLILDVVPGRGGMFSLEGPEGVRFLIRSRVFTDAEIAALRAAGRI
ncbi:MAG: DUF779 domain-containing protein [Acidobacteriaceae bacterium]|jgi:uncharacterized protein (DUF779 family)